MLRVTVEIIPFGNEAEKKTLGTMEIVNTGKNKNRPAYGDYLVNVVEGGTEVFGIENHKRADGFWRLISEAIRRMAI